MSSVRPALATVLVPTFNYGSLISESLRSVQSQTYRAWECIIIDDGSTDDTTAVVSEFCRSDDRFRLIRQPNSGAAAAKNRGLTHARGEFVQILDADDLLEARKLEEHVRILRDDPEVDIVYGDARYFTTAAPHERRFSMREPDLPWMPCVSGSGPELIRALLLENILVINAALIRRSVFARAGGFDESFPRMEDWEFWLRCAVAGVRFRYSDAPETTALVRSRSSSQSKDETAVTKWTLRLRERFDELLTDDELRALNAEYLREHRAWNAGVAAFRSLVESHVEHDELFMLIDDEQLPSHVIGRRGFFRVPAADGVYAGPPADDDAAIAAVREHLVPARPVLLVLAFCSGWYLDAFRGLRSSSARAQAWSAPTRAVRSSGSDFRRTASDH